MDLARASASSPIHAFLSTPAEETWVFQPAVINKPWLMTQAIIVKHVHSKGAGWLSRETRRPSAPKVVRGPCQPVQLGNLVLALSHQDPWLQLCNVNKQSNAGPKSSTCSLRE
eukprot:scaffold475407_cov33-Prasinocladus_malaysianus.AAC.1